MLRPHILTFNFYAILGLLITLSEHSGYEMFQTNAYHDTHHAVYAPKNLGVIGALDELHETRARKRPPKGSNELTEERIKAEQ